ncbi:Do family serine endopeptidase [Ponticaulis sp.]|uniref:Do family serine endopeptidase n=1 Tax=Ponticaulis sp. TaxID=2020902 RepID=UPI000B6C663A|nr:Do family serine endopeptidase [Ponticaulis sp.]MAI90428.1 Do family protease [Ponticaulis sp.]OUY00129.1 MAG: Do family protease [Hyphomonadaceae bacterium TMED5]|tara:strand:- start:44168 stop:45694 length:1527 start_codon:yes stop_codon:yes gene_type:complete
MQIQPRTKFLGLSAALVAGTALGATLIGPALSQTATGEPIVIEQPRGAPLSFAELIEQVSPAVVSVNVVSEREVAGPQGMNPQLFEFFRNNPNFEEFFNTPEDGEPETREARSLGSGFFISADGLIVTNNHVVADATEIQVVLEDGRELEAELVGTDERTDLAVLRVIEPGTFSFVEFETDADVRRGDWVVALGNPFGFGGTATAGIVSADGRQLRGAGPYTDYLQIDAAINRGNSGGPTFDLNGRVIGVNTAIVSPSGGSVGIGFAIPAELANQITDQIVENGRVIRGWLGVSIQNFSEDMAEALGYEGETGALVAQVVTDSPAASAGFRRNDVILEIDGVDMDDSTHVTRTVGGLLAGSEHEFKVLRNNEIITIDVTVEELPDNVADLPTDQGSTTTPDSPADTNTGKVLGMSLSPLSDDQLRRLGLDNGAEGLLIRDVDSGSTASRLGFAAGQAILEVNFQPVASVADFESLVDAARESGRESVLISVRLNRQTSVVALSIEDEE